jgi:hypothetical protein
VIPEGGDELAFVHLGVSVDSDLLGSLLQVPFRPIVVAAGLTAAFTCTGATGANIEIFRAGDATVMR